MGEQDRYHVVDSEGGSAYPPGVAPLVEAVGGASEHHSATVEGPDGKVTEGTGTSRDEAIQDAIDKQ